MTVRLDLYEDMWIQQSGRVKSMIDFYERQLQHINEQQEQLQQSGDRDDANVIHQKLTCFEQNKEIILTKLKEEQSKMKKCESLRKMVQLEFQSIVEKGIEQVTATVLEGWQYEKKHMKAIEKLFEGK